ncbi:unnamed protein product [Brassica oleracea var. botrytis]|uniref:(rape) hypothetical protein n=2 Tax=Brassica napus TaxID=3708 RepID=A0A816U8J9_BRANA|nr:unnamed protein product [Brassica napus]
MENQLLVWNPLLKETTNWIKCDLQVSRSELLIVYVFVKIIQLPYKAMIFPKKGFNPQMTCHSAMMS